ncbi:MAG: PfkB family carbohydrate kinase [Mycobacteriales bacterium]
MSVAPALFAGLCTVDVIQAVEKVPAADEKTTASRQTVAAGGPATNAAVTYAHLGGRATLLTGVGKHALAAGVRTDLARCGVKLVDAVPERREPPPVSTILVTLATGERAVVSTNANGYSLDPPAGLLDLVGQHKAVLVDGHHPDLARAVLVAARWAGIRTMLDGGSWKPNTPGLLPYLDVAVCSADFHAPGTEDADEVLAYLRGHGVTAAAVTDGSAPVRWSVGDTSGEVEVPVVDVVDTLGAGDVFHGALLHALVGNPLDATTFPAALTRAAAVAARSCASFGTRDWLRRRSA